MSGFKDFLKEGNDAFDDALLESMAPVELVEAEYQGKTVELNKPMRDSDGNKKFKVFVKNDKGNVVVVRFGDPDMSIKRDDPKRRKAFRDRHDCKNKTDKTTAGYWSCALWSKKSVTDILSD